MCFKVHWYRDSHERQKALQLWLQILACEKRLVKKLGITYASEQMPVKDITYPSPNPNALCNSKERLFIMIKERMWCVQSLLLCQHVGIEIQSNLQVGQLITLINAVAVSRIWLSLFLSKNQWKFQQLNSALCLEYKICSHILSTSLWFGLKPSPV